MTRPRLELRDRIPASGSNPSSEGIHPKKKTRDPLLPGLVRPWPATARTSGQKEGPRPGQKQGRRQAQRRPHEPRPQSPSPLTVRRKTVPNKTVPNKTVPNKTVPEKTIPPTRGIPSQDADHDRRLGDPLEEKKGPAPETRRQKKEKKDSLRRQDSKTEKERQTS